MPAVVALYQREVRLSPDPPPPGLAPYFERTFLDHPWVDPEICSLVYEADDGGVLGFLGAHVRRIRLDGTPMRMACAGQLVADPTVRRRGVGAILVRDFLAGPQELSITDGATGEVAAVWERFGGLTRFPQSIEWTRLLRPGATAAGVLERRGHPVVARLLGPLSGAVDAGIRRRTSHEPPGDLDPPEQLGVGTVLEQSDVVAGKSRLRVDYDEPFLEWLFGEMSVVSARGELVRRAVRRQGRLVGWYVAYLPRGGIGQTMHVAAVERAVETVLDALFDEAGRRGVSALQGRLEPALFEPLSVRRCLLRHGERALAHSRDPAVVSAVARGETILSRMEGEWWMGHHLEPVPGRTRS